MTKKYWNTCFSYIKQK